MEPAPDDHDHSVSGFFFCVWSAPAPDPDGPPSELEAVYLRHRAETHIMEELTVPLYDSAGISLLMSDDEVIPPPKVDCPGDCLALHRCRSRAPARDLGGPRRESLHWRAALLH